MNNLKSALLAAFTSFRPYSYQNSAPKARNDGRKASGKTKKGAIHKQGPVFRSRNLAKVNPALYRRLHLGVVTIEPNYLKPHPAPRWRNRWISA